MKLYLINILREDKIWQQCVTQDKLTDDTVVLCELDGPESLINQFFYVSNIRFLGLECDISKDIAMVGNKKEW